MNKCNPNGTKDLTQPIERKKQKQMQTENLKYSIFTLKYTFQCLLLVLLVDLY